VMKEGLMGSCICLK